MKTREKQRKREKNGGVILKHLKDYIEYQKFFNISDTEIISQYFIDYVKLVLDILLAILNVIAVCVVDNTFSLVCYSVASVCWAGCVVFDVLNMKYTR